MLEQLEEHIERLLGAAYEPGKDGKPDITLGEVLAKLFAQNYGKLTPMQSGKFHCNYSPVGEFGLDNGEILQYQFLKGTTYAAILQTSGAIHSEKTIAHYSEFLQRRLSEIAHKLQTEKPK